MLKVISLDSLIAKNFIDGNKQEIILPFDDVVARMSNIDNTETEYFLQRENNNDNIVYSYKNTLYVDPGEYIYDVFEYMSNHDNFNKLYILAEKEDLNGIYCLTLCKYRTLYDSKINPKTKIYITNTLNEKTFNKNKGVNVVDIWTPKYNILMVPGNGIYIYNYMTNRKKV